jgi:hypothetical protein
VTILKLQRSLHASMLQAKELHDFHLKTTGLAFNSHGSNKLQNASYTFGTVHLEPAAFAFGDVDDGGDDDGWDDTDDGSGDAPLEDDDPGGGDPIGGDGYSAEYSSYLSGYTTPSGQELQWCTIYNAILSFSAGGLAGAIAAVDALGGAATLTIGVVVFTPPVLIGILGILAAYWALCAILC